MKTRKKIIIGILTAALLVSLFPASPAYASEGEPTAAQANDAWSGEMLTVKTKEDEIIYEASEQKDLKLILKNVTDEELKHITVAPVTDTALDKYPFSVSNKEIKQKIDNLKAGEEKELSFPMKARADVKHTYYKVIFTYTAEKTDGSRIEGEKAVIVQTKEKEKPPVQEPDQKKEKEQNPVEEQRSVAEQEQTYSFNDEGVYNSASAGGESGTTSVPRVIVTGFSTDPGEVKAGSNFKLTIHLKNTSKSTAVRNMLFDVQAPTEGSDANTASPAFLPVSGSSSIYLENIKAGGNSDISIDMNAKADLVQKPYSIELSMKYEDSQANQYESASALSIPVKQDPRFEFSEFEISPEVVSVGSEANVMCNLYNMGRIKLYNVKAEFTGKGIKKEEVFIGNVEPGATASIDAMLEAEKVTDGLTKIKMVLSYEDESGKVNQTEKEFQMEIIEEPVYTNEDISMDEEPKKSVPLIPVILSVVILAGGAAWIVYKKKKKRVEEEELADEFDRFAEDEHGES